jgi:UDP-N-acetylglucosamine:LPS N-acetylglucosamine transferase
MLTSRIMLVASGGGHWIQLSRLSEAFANEDALYVTTMRGVSAPTGVRPVEIVEDASASSPVKLPIVALQLLRILIRFKPHVVLSTGAAPGLLALLLAKLMGARTVWIDSIANSEELSWSGRMARRWADLWLTQWPHLVEQYPGLRYEGAVL